MKMRSAVLMATVAVVPVALWGQQSSAPARPNYKMLHDAAGDIASNPGTIDSTLSSALKKKEIRRAMKKVADWQLRHSEKIFTQDWTYAPLYSGLLATSEVTGDTTYRDAVVRASERFQWSLLPGRYDHADDEAIGQAYEVLYLQKKDPVRIAALKENLIKVMARPDDAKKDLWWWCDALYMAPSTFAEMSQLTGDPKYLAFADHEWGLTQQHLYSPEHRLFYRDASFFDKKEKNGQPVFWSRGNGWVLAGTARLLAVMPKDDPARAKYEALFRDMADKIASLQPADGLWRMGLLDQDSYEMGEVSGTGFFAYAMAWGINHGLLDRAKYEPVVQKAWAGMLKQVYQDGRLGSVQPIGAAPDALEAGSSWVYGVGAFLLTGSELDKMAKK